ncbi:hypothetical protein NQ315_002548 [Exocentrus adspersus]|uniref:Uncharacterized protein n=1 Tax=Exocentrus adspersus TaxID=1586481 RepID=A0AAV8VG02_9CUCU|nr:hypothetical protein NQ315_002548 [Exocentrus adspersus]
MITTKPSFLPGAKITLAVLALVAVTFAQDYQDEYEPLPPRPSRPAPPRVQPGYSGPASAPRAPPITILKQIDRHNDDGSYTYGYESSDGSFKIETKLPTGDVKGKYGYVDDVGKVRVVEYGATKYGFEPSGEGITVAPPTLVDESKEPEYYEQEPPRAALRNSPPPAPRPRPAPQNSFDYSPPQQFEPVQSAPPRAQIAGAAPAPVQHHFDFGPSSRPSKSFAPAPKAPRPRPPPVSFAQPAPIEEDFGAAPSPRAGPRITYAEPAPAPRRPAPQFAPAPRPAPERPAPSFAPAPRPRPAPAPVGGRTGGILDQLSKEYALPADSTPLHDISFGYY